MNVTQISNQIKNNEDKLSENKIIKETIENIMFVYNNFNQELTMLYESSNNQNEYKYELKNNDQDELDLELIKLIN